MLPTQRLRPGDQSSKNTAALGDCLDDSSRTSSDGWHLGYDSDAHTWASAGSESVVAASLQFVLSGHQFLGFGEDRSALGDDAWLENFLGGHDGTPAGTSSSLSVSVPSAGNGDLPSAVHVGAVENVQSRDVLFSLKGQEAHRVSIVHTAGDGGATAAKSHDLTASVRYELDHSPNVIGRPVSDGMFGGILINSRGFDDYAEDSRYLGLTNVRFPGGTLAEQGQLDSRDHVVLTDDITQGMMKGDRADIVYDLTFPELMNPRILASDDGNKGSNDVATFTEALQLALEAGGSVTATIPIERYYSGVDMTDPKACGAAIARALADLRVFLDRLEGGSWNNGKYPPINFDLGNELYDAPIEYALIAGPMMEQIERSLGASSIDYSSSFQMSGGSTQFNNLSDAGYFETWFKSNGSAALPELDALGFSPDAAYTWAERATLLDEMMIEVLGASVLHIDALRHHYLGTSLETINDPGSLVSDKPDILSLWLSSIKAAGGKPSEVDYYVSAWSSNSSNGAGGSYGMAAAANTLAFFSHMIDIGVDSASVWGVAGGTTLASPGTLGTVITLTGQDGMSPQGEVLRLLAENTPGKLLYSSGQELVPVKGRSDDFLLYHYADADETVLYVNALDLGSTDLKVVIDISAIGHFDEVTVTYVGTVDGASNGIAEVTTTTVDASNGTITLSFDQSFKVAQIILPGDDTIGKFHTGDSRDNYISGTLRNDSLNGLAGNDTLVGGRGEDWLHGGVGSDLIVVADGGDTVHGGHGFDTLRLTAFSSGVTIKAGSGLSTWQVASGTANSIETFVGTSHADRMHGSQEGADRSVTFIGGSGNDLLCGGSAADRLVGGLGKDVLYGGAGEDLLQGWSNGDRLQGGRGADRLYGGAGNDRLNGGTDTDRLFGGTGHDRLAGGDSKDTFLFSPNEGRDVITDFAVGLDVLDLSKLTTIDNRSEFIDVTSVRGADLYVDFGGGAGVTLVGCAKAHLGDVDLFFG